MEKKVTVKKETLLDMAELIDLPIDEKRVDVIVKNAEIWYNNANALSDMMMNLKYMEVIPMIAIRFKD
jgi:hypothetical protein